MATLDVRCCCRRRCCCCCFVQGTLTHMAPELLLHGHASRASDVYAFGILLWEMATGLRAFASESLYSHPYFWLRKVRDLRFSSRNAVGIPCAARLSDMESIVGLHYKILPSPPPGLTVFPADRVRNFAHMLRYNRAPLLTESLGLSVNRPTADAGLPIKCFFCIMALRADVPKALVGAAILRDQARPEWPDGSSMFNMMNIVAAAAAGAAGAAAHEAMPPTAYRQLAEACWAHEARDR
jgi:serine/threonine protein kinase